jgi:hypothetical protein
MITSGWLKNCVIGPPCCWPVSSPPDPAADERRLPGLFLRANVVKGDIVHLRPVAHGAEIRRLSPAFELAAKPFEVLLQNQPAGWPLGGIFLQQLADDPRKLVRHTRVELVRRIKAGIAMLVQQVEHALPLEGRPPGQKQVKHDAEGIQIAAVGDRLAGRLFGRQVFGGADQTAGGRQLLAGKHLGDAEIGELDRAVVGLEEVLRLEVAMNDAVVMGELEGGAELEGGVEHRSPRQPAFFLKKFFEVLAGDILHGVVVVAIVVAGVIEADDVRMVELFEDADLALEALQETRLLGQLRSEDLHRRPHSIRPGRRFLVRQKNLAHAAAAQLAVEDPLAQAGANHDGVRGGEPGASSCHSAHCIGNPGRPDMLMGC